MDPDALKTLMMQAFHFGYYSYRLWNSQSFCVLKAFWENKIQISCDENVRLPILILCVRQWKTLDKWTWNAKIIKNIVATLFTFLEKLSD